MLIIFNKSGSLLNVDFQYDSFSQGDMNVHDIDVIVLDDDFENYNFNGYVQFLRQGETEPSPKLIMTNKANLMYNEKTYNGYTFRMESDWYTAIAGTLKMTIEIKQYGDNGLASNKAYGIVNIPVQESVSAISQVESTITNEEYNSLLRTMANKVDAESNNVFSGTATFKNYVTLEGVKDNSYGQETIPLYVYGRDKNTKFRVNLPIKNGDVALKEDIPESLPASDVYEWAKQPEKPTYTKAEIGLSEVNNVAISQNEVNQITINKNDIETTRNIANEALNIANEKTSARVFDSYSAMIQTLKNAPKDIYKVGTNLLIRELNVPDYWVSRIFDNNNGITGYYEISELEGEQVSLDDYYNKSEIDNKISPINQLINQTSTNANSALSKSISNAEKISTLETTKLSSSDLKNYLGDLAFKDNITKTELGLGNVDNTSDINKPISIAVQQALDSKANKADVYTKEEADEKFSKSETNPEFKSIRIKNATGNNLLSVQDKNIVSVDSSLNVVKLGNNYDDIHIKSYEKPKWEKADGTTEELATIKDLSGQISPVFDTINVNQIKTSTSKNLISVDDSQIGLGDDTLDLTIKSFTKPKLSVNGGTALEIATIKDVADSKNDIDLTDYYTKTEINTELNKKADKTSIPTQTSQLINDSDYVNETQLENELKSYATTQSVTNSLNNHVTNEIFNAQVYSIQQDYNYKLQFKEDKSNLKALAYKDNISKSDIGLGNVNNVAISQNEVNQIGTNATNISNLATRVGTAETSINSITSTANEALSVAKGASRAFVFNTYEDMVSTLKSASNNNYRVGDNLLIKATDIPDYWISGILSTNSGDYGYYEISPLEGGKIDLINYYTKTETDNKISDIGILSEDQKNLTINGGKSGLYVSIVSVRRPKWTTLENNPVTKELATLEDIDNSIESAIGNINSVLDQLNGEVI